MPKKGRGTLKGLKVAKKSSETSDGKLSITFSRKLVDLSTSIIALLLIQWLFK